MGNKYQMTNKILLSQTKLFQSLVIRIYLGIGNWDLNYQRLKGKRREIE